MKTSWKCVTYAISFAALLFGGVPSSRGALATVLTQQRPPILVTTTADRGQGSLRQAIEDANASPGADRIDFNIRKNDRGFNGTVWTISPSSPLPALTDNSTTINGVSQTWAQGNTNLAGPEVVINGSLAGPADGLRISSHGNVIYSLGITGFSGNGIIISAGGSNNRIGPLNVIWGNQGAGIAIVSFNARGNRICANSIFDNGRMGIDLRADGVTANDPGDLDEGANQLMNYPEITLAETYKLQLPDGTWSYTSIVQGTIDTQNPSAVMINVFFNEKADPSGSGEGKMYAGSTTPDASGNWSLTVPGYSGRYIAATASDAEGNTSEFSQAKQVVEKLGGIAVLSGGETWPIGSTQTIRWVSSGIDGPVKIDLLTVEPPASASQELRDMSVPEFLRLASLPCGPPPAAQSALEPLDGSIDNPEWWWGVLVKQETIIERTANDGSEQWVVEAGRGEVPVQSMAVVRITPLGYVGPNTGIATLAAYSEWIVLTPPAPDFVVKDLFVVPPLVRAGGMTVVTFNIVNEGSAAAGPATHQVRLLANRRDPFGVGPPIPVDLLLTRVTTGPLAAGVSAPFREIVMIPSDIAPGAGMIRIGADATNAVSESNERNNTAEFPITITGGPF